MKASELQELKLEKQRYRDALLEIMDIVEGRCSPVAYKNPLPFIRLTAERALEPEGEDD